jgi:hypothetical protein
MATIFEDLLSFQSKLSFCYASSVPVGHPHPSVMPGFPPEKSGNDSLSVAFNSKLKTQNFFSTASLLHPRKHGRWNMRTISIKKMLVNLIG